MDIESRILDELRSTHRGAVLTPTDAGYDEARRMWNARFDRRPAAIARCTGAADAMAAVNVARNHCLDLAVKSGGHAYAGNCVRDGGLLIDLSGMTGIRVDPVARRARVQPGVRWGAFDHEAQVFGLAMTGGTVSTVGVAGFTLGGGSGHLTRRYGLALDNLLSADVVTAGGEFVHASAESHPDLFWGLRGGSGNFGLVASFEFALHPVGPEVLTGQAFYPFERAPEVLRFYRDFMADAPDALQCYAFFLRIPPLAEFPEAFHGKVAIDLMSVYTGPVDEGRQILAPLHELGSAILEFAGAQQYVAVQRAFDAGMPEGQRWFSRAHYLAELSDDAIDVVVAHVEALPGDFSIVYFEPQGGAVGRADPGSTAFPHRDAAFSFHILPGWSEPGEDSEIMAWGASFHEALAPHATGGVYANLLGDGEEARVRAAYGANHERLRAIKKRYDPKNLFRSNHNVEPAA